MSGNSFGTLFRITTFGESHGEAIGVVVDGCPSGIPMDMDFIQSEMDRRRPGSTRLGTARNESDRIEILSGVYQGKTTGAPIAMMIRNENQHSKDYSKLENVYRPGHADYTYDMKWGIRDPRGGGRSSGRETAARVAAGALAKLVLKRKGVEFKAGIYAIAGIEAESSSFELKPPLFLLDSSKEERILAEIKKARMDKDSLGGVIALKITGCPAGIGEPCFDKLDAVLSHAMMSIGAVKAVEFGIGTEASRIRGSENNDEMDGNGFMSNNSGGILGGISTGEDIEMKIHFKPTPSIARTQHTVDRNNSPVEIEIEGRHDPLIVIRALPVVEAMAAVSILDMMMRHEAEKSLR